MYGTAVSPTTVLQRADIGSYPSSDPQEVTAEAGSPHTIRCQPVKCFPKPSFSWALVERGRLDVEGRPEPVVTDGRVQIDDQGKCIPSSSELTGFVRCSEYNIQSGPKK